MKIYHCDEYSSSGLKSITVMTVMELSECNENMSVWWNSLLTCKFIKLVKMHPTGKNSSKKIRAHHIEENASLTQKFITLMEIHQFDENQSLQKSSMR